MKNKLICFDFFDTIVSRKNSPEEIKRSWARKCCNYFNLECNWKWLYQLRLKIESQFYGNKENNFEFQYLWMIKKVYQSLRDSFNVVFSLDSFSSFAVNCEIAIELNSQVMNADIKSIIDFCVEKEFDMIIISDYYFGEKYLKTFLNNVGLDNVFQQIFVSSDYFLSKKQGDIYLKIKKTLIYEQYIMIGDNEIADINNSQRAGFFPILVHREKIKNFYSKVDSDSYLIQEKRLKSINKRNKIDLSAYSFTLYRFIERLYNQTVKDDIHDLFFLSRDGEFLKILFDIYNNIRPGMYEVKTHYLMVSRNSTYIASCQSIYDENFDGIFSNYYSVTLYDFLYSLSFSDQQIEAVVDELKLERDYSFTKNQDNFVEKKLKKCDIFNKYYEQNRKSAREALCKYLYQEVGEQGVVAIVDVGWRGTIQDNLYRLFNSNTSIIGYYYGITKTHNSLVNNQKIGLMFNSGQLSRMEEYIYYYHPFFMETILVGSHGKVVCYKQSDNFMIPVLEKDSDIMLFEHYISKLRISIETNFKEIDSILFNSPFISEDYYRLFELIHFTVSRFFPFFRHKDYYRLTHLHSDGFGFINNNYDIKSKGLKHFFEDNKLKNLREDLITYLWLRKHYRDKN